jgi:hypothetical protein
VKEIMKLIEIFKSMFKTDEILTEMPQKIDALKWHDLFNYEKNQKYYNVIRAEKYKKLYQKINDHVSIYQFKTEFICLDTKQKLITYFMKYKVANNGIIGSFVWQALVWRDKTSLYLSGIPQKIFFDYLLQKFGCVVTDSEQTWDGERFWGERIAEALDSRFYVYYYNFKTKELVEVKTISEFRNIEQKYDIWGPSELHKMKRMIISTRELPI